MGHRLMPRNDKKTAQAARQIAAKLRDCLIEQSFRARGPVASGNVQGGWVVEAESIDGLQINVEVVGGPWEDDGTWPQ